MTSVLICDDGEDVDQHESLIDAILALERPDPVVERPDPLVAPARRGRPARLLAPAFGPRMLRLCAAAVLIIAATATVGLVRIRPPSTHYLDSTLRPAATLSVATR